MAKMSSPSTVTDSSSVLSAFLPAAADVELNRPAESEVHIRT